MIRVLIPALAIMFTAGAEAASIRHDALVQLEPNGGIEIRVSSQWDGNYTPEFLPPMGLEIVGRSRDGDRMVTEMRGTIASPPDGEGAYVPGSSGWLPLVSGQSFDYRVEVRADHPWKAVLPGRLVREEETPASYLALYESETPQDSVPLMAGPWQVEETRRDGILIRTWLDAGNAHLARDFLDLTAEHIGLYSRWIGPYPFSAFHVVSGALPVGWGFPGLTYIGSRVLRLPFVRSSSLGHEILHNWWGNGVYIDYAGGNWAEGLTTYMADHEFAIRRNPAEAREMRLNWLRDYAALPPERDAPAIDFRAKIHDAAQVIGYHKVAFLFHMLRGQVGDQVFAAAVGRLWKEKRFQTASWEDVRAAFEATSGRDFLVFFTQWLGRTGAPSLTLENAEYRSGKLLFAITQESPAYAMDLPVVIDGKKTVVRLEGARGEFAIPLAKRPETLAIDPDFDLFRRLDAAETPPVLRDVTLDPSTRVVGEGEAARALARAMIDGEADFQGPEEGRPLLLINSGRIKAPPEVAGKGTARVWAGRREGRPFIVIEADDEQALEALIRPLPHYGRQGWLVFEGSKVTEKGSWPAGEGGLIRKFSRP